MVDPAANWTKVRTSDGEVLYLATADLQIVSIEASAAALALIAGPWTAWTPALNQGGAVAINTPTYAKYHDIGTHRFVQANFTANASGTSTNTLTVSLPPGQIAANSAGHVLGSGQVNLGASGVYGVEVWQAGTGANPTVSFLRQDINVPTGAVGVDPVTAIISGNPVRFSAFYELA